MTLRFYNYLASRWLPLLWPGPDSPGQATEVANDPLICNKQVEAVRQCASLLFPGPDSVRLLMELNVPKTSFLHVWEFMTHRGGGGGGLLGRNGVPGPSAHPHSGQILGNMEGHG